MADKKVLKLLSIDAWRDPDGGWQWNQWFNEGTVPAEIVDEPVNPRRVLKYLRDSGALSWESVGKLAIDDDGYNVVIIEKGNRRPLLAIEYGSQY